MAHTYFELNKHRGKGRAEGRSRHKQPDMKTILTSLMAVAISTAAVGQQKEYLSEDFNAGIPASFTSLDRDENPISSSLYKGVTLSPSWAANAINNAGNQAAYSFSRATFAMEQENWLITPAVELPAGSQAVLRWAAKSVAESFPEDYKVMISAASSDPSDFTELFSVSGESYFWTDHALSLADYAGQTVYVAFVCTSNNKFILAVDDIYIGEPEGYDFAVKSSSSHFAGMEATAPVSGTLRNTGRTAEITQVDCEAASGVLSQTQAVTLAPGETLDYHFDMPIENHSVNRYSIKLRFADGTESTVLTDSVISSYFPRTLVLDEGTGNWCNSCPDMFPYLAKVKERMGSDVIVISAHFSPDPLQCPVYSSNLGIGRWIQGLPGFVYNRTRDYLSNSVYDTEGYLERAMLDETTAMVTATAEQEGDKINIKAKAEFGVDYDNSRDYYQVGFALIDDAYEQHDIAQNNNSTTFKAGEYMYMPGGENGTPGELIVYRDLPIEATTAFTGVEGALPEDIKAGETYDVEYQMTIPEGRTYGDDDLTVVAFVFNSRVGNLLNACSVPLKLDATAVGIGSLAAAQGLGASKLADGRVAVSLPAGVGEGSVRLYSLDGRMVKAATVSPAAATLDCRGLSGCYLVEVCAGGQKAVSKLVF